MIAPELRQDCARIAPELRAMHPELERSRIFPIHERGVRLTRLDTHSCLPTAAAERRSRGSTQRSWRISPFACAEMPPHVV